MADRPALAGGQALRLRPDQLAVHLRKNLVPLYLVFGEEPLQVLEAADAIRLAARERGYAERQCLTVETGFEWGALARLAASPSLFTDRRLLELRLDNAKTGDAGAKALADYAARPAEDAVLLVTAGKLDWNTQKPLVHGVGSSRRGHRRYALGFTAITRLDRAAAAGSWSESYRRCRHVAG